LGDAVGASAVVENVAVVRGDGEKVDVLKLEAVGRGDGE